MLTGRTFAMCNILVKGVSMLTFAIWHEKGSAIEADQNAISFANIWS